MSGIADPCPASAGEASGRHRRARGVAAEVHPEVSSSLCKFPDGNGCLVCETLRCCHGRFINVVER